MTAAPNTSATPTALHLEVEDGIAIITFDDPSAPINALSSRLSAEFSQLFRRIEMDSSIRGAVLLSGKPDVWIAGADIDELTRLTSSAQGETLSRTGQELLNALEALPKPVVAAIHGVCLGGGLEVALACHWRILTNHAKSTCALPEVQLGLLPGAGGTQRLPRLIGLRAALDLMLTGRTVRASRARTLGLVDEVVHPAVLRRVAVQRARELASKDPTQRPRTPRKRSAAAFLLEGTPLGQRIVLRQAKQQVLKKTGGHYPAPLAILDAVISGLAGGMTRGLAVEARHFGALATTAVCKELTFLFYATTALKKERGEGAAVSALGVIGAGFMGAGIAGLAVQQGVRVRVRDTSMDRIAHAMHTVRGLLEERNKRRRISALELQDQYALLSGGTDWTGFRHADIVIEAVFEDLTVKHDVVRAIEVAAPDAIVATNTSTIPIARIADASLRPERVIGMHFFSPVHKMPLLEVIETDRTDPQVTATVVAFGRRLGKTVIVVRDGPGFYVNRILAPYLNEAGRLLDDGASIEAVDAALTAYGFPVGPLTLLDEVGLDVAGKSGQVMLNAFGDRMLPSETVRRVVESGRLGRKGKQGFYRYDTNGKRQGADSAIYALAGVMKRHAIPANEMVQRTVLPMLNEAVRCLDDGILGCPRDGDVGAVFGIGFPPFRGGPFRAIDAMGVAEIVRQLAVLDAQYPGRFTPAARLREMAARNERFYPG
jgi:3-hydroxyacyl-CoA dehydrogenase/enoyl-CoA hydratase/3-hydroxybutyryl-CoA epimerase